MSEDFDSEEENVDVEVEEVKKKKNTGLRALVIVVVALAIIVGVSLMPLYRWSGGKIKDFNLLSDIFPQLSSDSDSVSGEAEGIDPALKEAMNDGAVSLDGANVDSALAGKVPVYDETGAVIAYAPAQAGVAADSVLQPVKPARVGDLVQIEDYTSSQTGLRNLRAALASGRLARVAVLGDSYIEGDIFTQDVRAQLQSAYGGSGVGYMNLFSEFPGFRRSVKQGGKGWTTFASNGKGEKAYFGISEHYFKPSGDATATYSGTSHVANADRWDTARFLFIAPKGGVVKVKNGGEWQSHEVQASPDVQCITAPGGAEFAVQSSTPSIIGLGVWLDANKGISVDCMSSRGFSGITLKNVNANLCRQMAKFVNYDLIVLEFGINAMSAKQTDYSVYTKRMEDVVNHMRACYPNADILIMGIGDRGEKKGGEVHSMSTSKHMIAAQRELARRTHSLFWDTQEAMGGQDAIVRWAQSGKANKDYIHLTHKGGQELATQFVKAVNHNIKK